MNEKCRLCLMKCEEESFKNIFDTKLRDKLICDEVRDFAGIQLLMGNGLPNKICQGCLEKLSKVIEFRMLIIFSDKSLQEIALKQPSQVKDKSNTVIEMELVSQNKAIIFEVSATTKSASRSEHACDTPSSKDQSEKLNRSSNRNHLIQQMGKDNLDNNANQNFKEPEVVESNLMYNCHLEEGMSSYNSSDNDLLGNDNDPDTAKNPSDDITNGWWDKLEKNEIEQGVSNLTSNKIGEKTYYCKECKLQFKNRYYLRNHNAQYHRGMHVCEICNKAFPVQWQLKNHQRRHTGERPFACELCGKLFRNNSTLIVHRKRHSETKSFECNLCQRSFLQQSELRLHQLSHTEERRYICEICSKAFKYKRSLDRHLPFHNEEKTLPCPNCDKMFPSQHSLSDHQRSHRSKKKISRCDECGKKFTTPGTLKIHQRIHSGEKPFECNICQKTFTQSSILVRHMRVHSGETPYSCKFCPRRFPYSHHLLKHIKSHHS